jgi:hypothetical protein
VDPIEVTTAVTAAGKKKVSRTKASLRKRVEARADLRLLKPVDHRTAGQQAELNVIRARDALVRARTLLVNRLAAWPRASDFDCRPPSRRCLGRTLWHWCPR